MRHWSFAKGHGTENDFVLLLDRDGRLDVGERDVRFLCDRHAGVGGDGLLRAVWSHNVPGWEHEDVWFMDYRNADGSIAEMCGNGVRVFVRHLLEQDLVLGPRVRIATRAGIRETTVLADGRIRVGMGPVEVTDQGVRVSLGDESLAALTVDVGNPHAVCFVDDLDHVDLTEAPHCAPAAVYPTGVNVEFVRAIGDGHIAMRVFERGVGETRSCGTGTVAAAAAAHRRLGDGVLPARYRVDVPGGEVEVELDIDEATLTGPAVVVAHGEVRLPD